MSMMLIAGKYAGMMDV
uniref:Uncharacterized protein n=1 Tax=Rhizophora mucronata TaxID=61149 RepID=A0A2P2QER4_RHIMU